MSIHIFTIMDYKQLAALDEVFTEYHARRQVILRDLLKINFPGQRITPEQFIIVDLINNRGPQVTITDLVDLVETPHANISRTLDRMEKRGLIMRTQDRDDRRRMNIKLSLEGRRMADKVETILSELYEKLFADYGPDELQRLQILLARGF